MALVVASLVTRPEPAARMDQFFGNLHTPADQASESGGELLIVNALSPRRAAGGKGILRAYRTDLRGFAAGWAISFALVGAFWLLLVWIR